MWKKMAQFNMNSVFKVNADEVIEAQKETLTVKNTCSGLSSIELSKEKPYIRADIKQDLNKAGRKINK